MNIRALAAQVIYQVLHQGVSLSVALPTHQKKVNTKKDAGKDRALLAELCYGVLRNLPQLEQKIISQMDRPFKNNKLIIHYLLLVGCFQIYFTRIPEHASISETVEACKQLGSRTLGGVVNGVLRNILRNKTPLATDYAELRFNSPKWFLKKIQSAYPDFWRDIADACNEKPPMWLRNNSLMQSKEEYQKLLSLAEIEFIETALPDGILLKKPIDVTLLPEFDNGSVYIQDGAAQWAANILDPKPHDLVLDLCSAPGGKSSHLFAKEPTIDLVAADIDETRLDLVKQNFERLKVTGQVFVGDGTDISSWWSGGKFDKILLDAPCSATGVIRHHPDIKWLRKKDDINTLAKIQAQMLEECWKWLKPGGTLLYATCSILPAENKIQIADFLQAHSDASMTNMPDIVYDYLGLEPGLSKDFLHFNAQMGWQILPGADAMDGFFYSLLKKEL